MPPGRSDENSFIALSALETTLRYSSDPSAPCRAEMTSVRLTEPNASPCADGARQESVPQRGQRTDARQGTELRLAMTVLAGDVDNQGGDDFTALSSQCAAELPPRRSASWRGPGHRRLRGRRHRHRGRVPCRGGEAVGQGRLNEIQCPHLAMPPAFTLRDGKIFGLRIEDKQAFALC